MWEGSAESVRDSEGVGARPFARVKSNNVHNRGNELHDAVATTTRDKATMGVFCVIERGHKYIDS